MHSHDLPDTLPDNPSHIAITPTDNQPDGASVPPAQPPSMPIHHRDPDGNHDHRDGSRACAAALVLIAAAGM